MLILNFFFEFSFNLNLIKFIKCSFLISLIFPVCGKPNSEILSISLSNMELKFNSFTSEKKNHPY